MFKLFGMWNEDGSDAVELDPSPQTEDSAISAAIYCADDWGRVVVERDGEQLGHAKVPMPQNRGAVWFPNPTTTSPS